MGLTKLFSSTVYIYTFPSGWKLFLLFLWVLFVLSLWLQNILGKKNKTKQPPPKKRNKKLNQQLKSISREDNCDCLGLLGEFSFLQMKNGIKGKSLSPPGSSQQIKQFVVVAGNGNVWDIADRCLCLQSPEHTYTVTDFQFPIPSQTRVLYCESLC